MTIDRSLYILTQQIKQQTDHKFSIEYVGFDPREINHNFSGLAGNSSYSIHRVKLNLMGAKHVETITYDDLITDAWSYRELVLEEDSEETRL